MSSSSKERIRLFSIGLFFALMFSYAGASITLNVTRGKFLIPLVRGWLVTPRDGRLFVSQVWVDGPAAQLQLGDEIVALDGQRLSSVGQMYGLLKDLPAGSSRDLTVLRSG